MQNALTVWRAQSERISCEASGTSADRIVIFRRALRSQSAGIWTRIRTFLIYTRQMWWALGVHDALRPT